MRLKALNIIAGLALAASLTACAPSNNSSPTQQPGSGGNPKPTGAFVKAAHTTTGTAKVVQRQGQSVLELDQAFKTDDGPALSVLLYRGEQPPLFGLNEKDYVNLGQLQSVTGAQSYKIPTGVNASEYKSAVIWCRQFNTTFGYASL
jgi:hypothetical protein